MDEIVIGSPIVTSFAEIEARYNASPRQTPSSSMWFELQDTVFTSQPPYILGSDGALLWPLMPILGKKAESFTPFVRKVPSPERCEGMTLVAAVDGFSYYHWLTGVLPKLLAASQFRDLSSFDRILVNQKPARSHRGDGLTFVDDFLSITGIDSARVLHVERGLHLQLARAVFIEEPCYDDQTRLKPWALSLLRTCLLKPMQEPRTSSRRLYVSRASARRRRLANEDRLWDKLVGLGFERVVLESLSFAEQVSLFADAAFVVGVHGAGLANALFSRPGTGLVELSHAGITNPCFANLASLVGLRYGRVTVSPIEDERKTTQRDVVVDVGACVSMIEKAL